MKRLFNYNGFYVWDSKILQNPKIMFIGINPGNGNPENDVKKVITKPCQQMSYLEYLDVKMNLIH